MEMCVRKLNRKQSASKNSIETRGVNRMVRHDTISILVPSDTLFADSSKYSTIRYRSISIDISILSYYIPILNNHLHFY